MPEVLLWLGLALLMVPLVMAFVVVWATTKATDELHHGLHCNCYQCHIRPRGKRH